MRSVVNKLNIAFKVSRHLSNTMVKDIIEQLTLQLDHSGYRSKDQYHAQNQYHAENKLAASPGSATGDSSIIDHTKNQCHAKEQHHTENQSVIDLISRLEVSVSALRADVRIGFAASPGPTGDTFSDDHTKNLYHAKDQHHTENQYHAKNQYHAENQFHAEDLLASSAASPGSATGDTSIFDHTMNQCHKKDQYRAKNQYHAENQLASEDSSSEIDIASDGLPLEAVTSSYEPDVPGFGMVLHLAADPLLRACFVVTFAYVTGFSRLSTILGLFLSLPFLATLRSLVEKGLDLTYRDFVTESGHFAPISIADLDTIESIT